MLALKVLKMVDRKVKQPSVLDASNQFHQATVWWLASTACPLLAGTFGPIANLFSVCALVHVWSVRETDSMHLKDPPSLIIVNGVSLFLAVIANIFLLLNFAHRIRYTIAQPVTVILWYISCTLLFAATGAMKTYFFDSSTERLSQGWWYALISGVIYSTISTLLVFNMLGSLVFRAYPPSITTLSIPQRTLMLVTIIFSLYLAMMAGVFSALEGWQYVDAVYWADYTLLTVGLGSDFPLLTTAGRMAVIPFSAFGIVLLGLVVQSVRGLILERGKEQVLKRRLGKQVEDWREYILAKREEWAMEHRMLSEDRTPETIQRMQTVLKRGPPIPFTHRLFLKARQYMMQKLDADDSSSSLFMDCKFEPWMKDEFKLMRLIEETASKVERYTVLTFATVAFLLVWGGGSLVFWASEKNYQGWTYPISLYFSYTSITTIGYGDFYPTSASGRPFFVIWSLIAVPTVTVLIASMGNTVVEGAKEATFWLARRSILPEKRTAEDIEHEAQNAEEQDRIGMHDALERQYSPSGSRRGTETPLESIDQQAVHEEKRYEPSSIDEDHETRHALANLTAHLAREIALIAQDISSDPNRKYSWEEWIRWIALLEESIPTAAQVSDNEASSPTFRDDAAGEWTWTWLSDNGPLFSPETEAEWIIGRLSARLDEVLAAYENIMGANGLTTSRR